jgi:hypothetical protein
VSRHIEIRLDSRGITCVARLLDEDAPATCDIVWDALPQSGQAYHAKYASNEVFCLVPPLSPQPAEAENQTIAPQAGDVMYFYFDAQLAGPQEMAAHNFTGMPGLVDLAVFYRRGNLLMSPQVGAVPGNVFAVIEENLDAFADACDDVFRSGSQGERLSYHRLAK